MAVTAQTLNVESKYLDDDTVFVVKLSLIVKIKERTEEVTLESECNNSLAHFSWRD
jgi:hypothetical protein